MQENISNLIVAQVGPGLVLLAIIIFIISAVAYYYRDTIRQLYEERFGVPKKTIVQQQIENEIVKMRKLCREQNFKEASIVMWQTLQKAAMGYLGLRRNPTQTARQFTVQLISSHPTAANLKPVVTLYERARYSDLPISKQEFDQANTAFTRFLTSIAASSTTAASAEGAEVE